MHQFILKLVNAFGSSFEHRVNCNNEESARYITETIFPDHKIVNISLAM